MKHAYIYILRCQDETLYTGIAVDLPRRLLQHYNQEKECAKYTKAHPMRCLEIAFEVENLSVAAKFEYRIKKLEKRKKEKLTIQPEQLADYMPEAFSAYAIRALSKNEIETINQAVCK